MEVVDVNGEFDVWRSRCRELLGRGVPPEAVSWRSPDDPRQGTLMTLFGGGEDSSARARAAVASPHVPRAFVSSSRLAMHHSDPGRWALLYRVLWRLTHGEPGLMEVRIDGDVARLHRLEAEVRRESHKAKAFVRFRKVVGEDGEDHFIAWHRLEHPVLPHIAPFFADRFASMKWTILTPRGSVSWDLERLRYGPACGREQAPRHDELEEFWKTYYRAIFNPARIKIAAMMSEMPQKHWPTMPETEIIRELLREAPDRVREMVARASVSDASWQVPEARSLDAIARALPACDACDLCERVRGAVMGEGVASARVVIVGEQPGVTEDEQGRPFVGPAGEVLRGLMEEVGLDASRCYLTNSVKAYQYEERQGRRYNKNPDYRQVNVCKPWLVAELESVRPRVVVTLGRIAAFALLGRQVNLHRERGEYRTRFAEHTFVTYHPAAILRAPQGAGRAQMRDALREVLEEVARILEG